MPLADGQLQVRDLLMGCGTPYQVSGFNPFSRQARADQTGERPWNHGGWSGAEWQAEAVVPMRVYIKADTPAQWLARQQALTAAFSPVGSDATDVELAFAIAGSEFVMFGRPRMVEPDTDKLRPSKARSSIDCAFVALDPFIYSAAEHVFDTGLPEFEGGLTMPFTMPFQFTGVLVGGFVDLENEGTADTALRLRIDGPVVQPRIVLQRPDGINQRLRIDIALTAGQWLDIDTGAHTVLLNGQSSRRAQTVGTFPILPPGVSRLRFFAAEHTAAVLSGSYRSAWW